MTRPSPTRLRFRPDGTFVIVQLTDIHWRDGGADDRRSRELIEQVLDAERPDLVALTGDVVEGGLSGDPAEALCQVAAPIIARGLPWAMVFGNHDDEGALSRLDLLGVQQGLADCLTERGPEGLTGVGNYVLRIASAETDALAGALYFLGFSSYGREGFPRGARVVRMHEAEAGFETWMRLEGGSVLTRPPLHVPG